MTHIIRALLAAPAAALGTRMPAWATACPLPRSAKEVTARNDVAIWAHDLLLVAERQTDVDFRRRGVSVVKVVD